jgi:formyltetrahydrofolate deformylase
MNAILLLTCPDQRGLVSRVSNFIFENGGNIISLHEHVDMLEKKFFLRVVWDMDGFAVPREEVESTFSPVAENIGATWKLDFSRKRSRIAVFVSKYEHCLQELLWNLNLTDFPAEIPLIISNHPDLKPMADYHKIPFHVFSITKENKQEQELKEIRLLKENKIDTIVLARYMQILSPDFVGCFPDRIINIHHSFLPAFSGSNPYKQAYDRGVKIIGATSHYVNEDLDGGPIIEQDIIRISHRDTTDDLIRKGRDLERIVLVKAIRYHIEHRILVNGKKTIVFD